MKHLFQTIVILLLVTCRLNVSAQEELTRDSIPPVPPGGARLAIEVKNGDTVFVAQLRDVWVFPQMKFKNKKQEQFYWRTVRDVKKALPYAKLVSKELREVNRKLVELSDDKERKKYLNEYEKGLFKQYEPELKKLTINQGKMLLKLIDRETDQTSYELVKIYRGSFSAVFWQGIARIFGSSLKTQYDTQQEEDAIIERIIIQVEAGQL